MAEQITPKKLGQPILEQGIANTFFFNGRILTAEDLRTEQEADRRQHEQVGRAIGAGVVHGLELDLVSDGSDRKAPVISVTSGLGLNGTGQAIALPVDVHLALETETQTAPVEAGLFKSCEPPKKVTAPINTGVYLLVACPASGFQGQAPMTGVATNGKVVGCGSRHAVEGVLFRLEELQVSTLSKLSQTTRTALADLMTKSDTASLSKLRNWLAHACFGTEELAGLMVNPFRRTAGKRPTQSPYAAYGAIDSMREAGSLNCGDVPLGLLYWSKQGVRFLDMWSVRRRPIPRPWSTTWPLPISERRLAEAEAAFLQFEDHMEGLLRSDISYAALASARANDFFRYFPSAGIIPLAGRPGFRGFNLANFTAGLTLRDQDVLKTLSFPDRSFIEGADWERLMRDALAYPPIDLSSGELIWTYLVRENIQAIDNIKLNPPPSYLIFSHGRMPFLGDARFNLSRWNYSNY